MMQPPPPPPPRRTANGGFVPPPPPSPADSRQQPQRSSTAFVPGPPAHAPAPAPALPPHPPAPSHAQPTASYSQPVSSYMAPLPAPPAVASTHSYSTPVAKSNEPYGEVPVSFSTTTGLAQRRTSEQMTAASTTPSAYMYGGATPTPSSYGAPPPNTYAFSSKDKHQSQASTAPTFTQYQQNSTALLFLVPTLLSILWWHESAWVIQVFLFVVLTVYAMDLINTRDGTLTCIWMGVLVLTMASGFGTLLQVDDAEATGGALIFYMLRLTVEGILFCAMACWCTLQFEWMYKDVPSVAIGMERSLHSILPPVAASILTHHLVRLLTEYWSQDRVATLTPHLFASLLAAGMISIGNCPSSFESGKFAISTIQARMHSAILLLVPGTMHVLMFRGRIISRLASSDELYDLVLVWAVPYLLQCGALMLSESSPYAMSNILFPKDQNTLRGSLIPMAVSLAASLAMQQRYIIPICHAVSYQFNGHDLPSTIVVSLYLTLATLSTLFALWTYGRKSSVTNEVLFGEYHEDLVQLSISVSGLLLGKSFGLPWNLTPLPILAFLGLSVWVTTRMMRYLSIFLFVIHAAGVVLFSYRFAAIDMTIPLAMPGLTLGLIRFGMVAVFGSVLIGLVTGFAVRPPGGFGAALLKRIDVAGITLLVYTMVLMVLELTLLKRPVPNQELAGKEVDTGPQDDAYLYDHATAFLTSALLIGIAMTSQRYRIISTKATIVAVSLAIGKTIAVLIDANESDGRIRTEAKLEHRATKLFFRAMVSAALLVVMLAPKAFLSPIHIKTSARYKRSLADGKPVAAITPGTYRIILVYTLIILPITLLATIPYVFKPLVMAMSVHYGGGAYYSMAPPFSEMIGGALALWGISALSMLNHYLPDGGAETWKKASALIFFMGVGVAVSAPTVPEWILGDDSTGVSNPYAAISSLGSKLVTQGKSRTGGWGILSACLGTLLAISGPLELRERRSPTGKKDQFFLFRLMVFSILFGSGVSWFITIQSMSEEHFVVMIVTTVGCMVVSFFGTVTCVLSYFLELENIDEVDQIAKVWVGAFAVFAFLTGTPQFGVRDDSIHAFGTGGWLSTYLTVSCCVTFSLACVLRARPDKNSATKGLGNLSCIASWLLAISVLYGQFGVAGMDYAFDVTNVLGIPISVFGTFVAAPILLALEGEGSNARRGRVSRVSAANTKASKSILGLQLKNLSPSNRLMPLIAGTAAVFLAATFYTILLRGSFLFDVAVAKSHLDVFAKVFGKEPDVLATLAEKSMSHSQALVTSARLAGSGIWTSDGLFGPLLHLGGFVATLPSLYLLITQQWKSTPVPKAQVTLALPLTLIPLVLCRGIPSLVASALIGLLGGSYQLLTFSNKAQRSQMRI